MKMMDTWKEKQKRIRMRLKGGMCLHIEEQNDNEGKHNRTEED